MMELSAMGVGAFVGIIVILTFGAQLLILAVRIALLLAYVLVTLAQAAVFGLLWIGSPAAAREVWRKTK